MTDFDKIENYYKAFDEWNRTFTPEGSLEFEISLDIMKKYTEAGANVLDLGGGPGRYTQELSKCGRIMSLGDISPELVAIAKEKNKGSPNIKSIDVVNAIDLGIYDDSSFDAVLCMGPLYHLTDDEEILASLKEIHRVLKDDGVMIAGFIPRLSGTAGIIERATYSPDQVTAENLENTFTTGVFINNSKSGFQEGNYLTSGQVREFADKARFRQLSLRSTRGLGYKLEKGILEIRENNQALYRSIMEIIEKSAEEEAVVNTCGHALYIGRKYV